METRMERYAKYRDEIRRMSEEEFADENRSRASTPEQAANVVYEQMKDSSAPTANDAFLKRRKRIRIFKLVVGLILLTGFLTWGILLFGRIIA